MKLLWQISLTLVLIVIYGFSLNKSSLSQDEEQIDKADKWADSVFNSLSEKERLMQLFMIHAYSNKGEKNTQELVNKVIKYKPGGIIFFQGNIKNQAEITNRLQNISNTPLLISTDGERGLGSRLKNTITFPKQMTLGAIENNDLIYQMGREIGRHCRRMGIHINFAPVADINNNPYNPVINDRSFGENKHKVAAKAIAYMRGMQDEGIIAVGKHFPGHGDTKSDSHHSLPLIKHNKEHLYDNEITSFKALIDAGIMGIMTAHLNIPSLDSSSAPASLSPQIIQGILKDSLQFKGICFTDALNMKGANVGLRPGEADAKALIAGNDILLFTADIDNAVKEIERAIREGKITQEDIDVKCKKILKAKYFCGLNEKQQIDYKNLWSDLHPKNAYAIERKLYQEAITLIKNDNELIPLKHLDTLKIASVCIGRSSICKFQSFLNKYADVKHFNISANASDNDFDKLYRKLAPYNLIIIHKTGNSNKRYKHYGNTKNSIDFIEKVSENKNTILNYPGIPYALSAYRPQNINAVIVSYEDNTITSEMSAQAIFGGIECKGSLPVSISKTFPCGTGYNTNKTRLGYSLPECVEMDSEILNKKIDSIAENAIIQKATPGCQIVVAKDGYVILNKSYGYHTYQKKRKVDENTIYDLASVTKISATLPLFMHFWEENKFELEKELQYYLPVTKGTNKENLLLQDLLIHQAGLESSIPFFERLIDKENIAHDLYSNKKIGPNSVEIYPNMYMNTDFKYKKGTFRTGKNKKYKTQVAPNMYLANNYRDTIRDILLSSDVKKNPDYLYSDLGFILLKSAIEEYTGYDAKEYCNNNLYKKIGAERTTFEPLKRFSTNGIAPSTNDVIFRKTVLQGYVHDPASALTGGYAGNAGLFSNALGVAKIMALYMQNGTYGGEKFFEPETVNKFTERFCCEQDNRRGLGFDKPETNKDKEGPSCTSASPSSYGHSGFTGTYAWNDPENRTIYVFLSNRTYPKENNTRLIEMNVRTDIQEVVYTSIKKYQKEHFNINEEESKNQKLDIRLRND